MKIFKILICLLFVLVISSCHDKDKTIYEYPDDDPTTEKGNIGDPCKKNEDCKEGLFCINKVCSEPAGDEDSINDPDENQENDEDISDTEPTDDSDTGKNDSDADIPDDTDTTPDEDSDHDEPVYIPECGNGILDPGEQCDEGINNNTNPGTYEITCRPNCTLAKCGDEIIDNGEACDDGNNLDGDYCSADCKTVIGFCGDGIEQWNEECDPVENPYCNEECTELVGFCGDGIKQSNEACDNAAPGQGGGAGIGPYYCSINCLEIIGGCGDSELQPNEECDDGDHNGFYGYCKFDCSGKGPYCGDGIRQSNEACDDGNNEENDYCSADCKTSRGYCGDGILRTDAGEKCDKANFGDGIGPYCSDNCTEIAGYCGDGIQQTNEECDRGSANGNEECPYNSALGCELCSAGCKKYTGNPRYCGDGIVSLLDGEACDKATFGDGIGSYCSYDCKTKLGECGDGIKQNNEICDNALPDVGNGEGIGSSCSGDCKKIIGTCGDGTKQTNEDCDLGTANGLTNCAYGEKNCDVCTDLCKFKAGKPHYCGDGQTESEYGEKCDDGIDNGKYDKCNNECSGTSAHCGDGKTQKSSAENCGTLPLCEEGTTENCCEIVEFIDGFEEEECDAGDNNGNTKCPYGQKNCKICSDSCKLEDGNATWCGDGKINGSETCDDGELNGTYGHCLEGCYGQGERCGDGEINGSEICDDGDGVNGQYGKCKTDCSGIGNHCGDGTTDTDNGEECDDGINNGHYTFYAPGSCNENCNGHGEGGYCGDGKVQGDEGEGCDEGENNGKTACEYGQTGCKVCNTGCQLRDASTVSYCGDGIIDSANGEVCDDRNNNDGDYCSADCMTITGSCGDGKVQNNELCDKAAPSVGEGEGIGTYCSADCKSIGGSCGDGIIQINEETCDDGNNDDGDYCSSDCKTITGYCGDGKIQENELCDNALPSVGEGEGIGAYCSDDCIRTYGSCGDSNLNGDEECDFGGNNGNTKCDYGKTNCLVCTLSCKLAEGETSYCGDGITDTENSEICDDGGAGETCNLECSAYMPRCGDGKIQRTDCAGYENCFEAPGMDEECDEGDEINGTYNHCNKTCSSISKCGDGFLNGSEFCDSGAFNGQYPVENINSPNCNDDCSGLAAYCGDNIIQSEECAAGDPACINTANAHEQCDNGTSNGSGDCAYIHNKTECFVCSASCILLPGTPHYCGDGITDPGEEACDDGEGVNGKYGKCNSNCSGTVTWRCGDGILQRSDCTGAERECQVVTGVDEICDDGDDLNGTPHHCNSTCTGQTLFCGDGIIQRENCLGYGANCAEVEGMNESCDEYEGINGTYGHCNSNCSGPSSERCGDGILQRSDCTGAEGECHVVTGAYEICDEGDNLNGKYNHCNKHCDGFREAGECGDGKTQKASEENCGTLPLCNEETTKNCCQIATFAEGEEEETCDHGRENNGYHDNCNRTCSGYSSCGDGEIGKDEICEPGTMETPIPCSLIPQFKGSGFINTCDLDCTPIIEGVCDNADSYEPDFFETMQTNCYDNDSIIPCPSSGEAFFGQEPNFTHLEHSFTLDAGNPTVITETLSQLVWQKETPSSYSGCLDDNSCTLDEAIDYCENSTTGGYDDWRLPTVAEFTTIMDYASTPHIYSGFENTHGSYWTLEGIVFSTVDGTAAPSTGTAQIKCVRSDEETCSVMQCIKQNRFFVATFDFAVIMNSQLKFSFWYFGETMQNDTWKNALKICEQVNFNGINKMRLPTTNELVRLINTKGGSLIPGFTRTAWTSTTLSTDPTQAYVVDFSSGSIIVDSKTNSNYVICVE